MKFSLFQMYFLLEYNFSVLSICFSSPYFVFFYVLEENPFKYVGIDSTTCIHIFHIYSTTLSQLIHIRCSTEEEQEEGIHFIHLYTMMTPVFFTPLLPILCHLVSLLAMETSKVHFFIGYFLFSYFF